MSGVFKGIKKVFKKVVKIVKKVAPFIILGAAIIFTAGTALAALAGPAGITSGIFSWSTTLANSSLFANTTLNAVIKGAVSHAISGAAIGGSVAAVTGGDITKGLIAGGVTGAVVGGGRGLLSSFTAQTAGTAARGVNLGGSAVETANLRPVQTPDFARRLQDIQAPLRGVENTAVGGLNATAPGGGGGGGGGSALDKLKKFFGPVSGDAKLKAVGSVLQGGATVLAGVLTRTSDETNAAKALAEQRDRELAASGLQPIDSSRGGLLTPRTKAQREAQVPPPKAQFASDSPVVRYRYNPETKTIDAIPLTATA